MKLAMRVTDVWIGTPVVTVVKKQSRCLCCGGPIEEWTAENSRICGIFIVADGTYRYATEDGACHSNIFYGEHEYVAAVAHMDELNGEGNCHA